MAGRPPLRDEEPPDAVVVVIRGGLLAAESVLRTAETSMRLHGFYGISVFAAAGLSIDELVRRTPELAPDRYKQLRSSTVGMARAAGLALLPTQDWPHFDIELPDLADGTIERLRACFDSPFPNPAL
jgi:hypothetical protein